MTIKIGNITMPAALEAVGIYHYPDYETLSENDGSGNAVMSRYMTAKFEYPDGLRDEHFRWWVSTVLADLPQRVFNASAYNLTPVTANHIVFRNYLLEHQAFRRCIVHRPTGVTTRYGYRRHGVVVRITGIMEVA